MTCQRYIEFSDVCGRFLHIKTMYKHWYNLFFSYLWKYDDNTLCTLYTYATIHGKLTCIFRTYLVIKSSKLQPAVHSDDVCHQDAQRLTPDLSLMENRPVLQHSRRQMMVNNGFMAKPQATSSSNLLKSISGVHLRRALIISIRLRIVL